MFDNGHTVVGDTRLLVSNQAATLTVHITYNMLLRGIYIGRAILKETTFFIVFSK